MSSLSLRMNRNWGFGENKLATKSVIKVSELEGAKRLDAEYYHPKYFATIDALHELRAISLKTVAKPVKRRFIPVAGQPFSYIEISEVNPSTGAINAAVLLGEEAPDRAQWIVRKGDVIISTVRPIRNAIALITDEEDGFVCSSGFAVLKAEKITPEFLFVFMKVGHIAELLDRKTTATMYPAVSWSDIVSAPIFMPDKKVEQFVNQRVRQAQSELKHSEYLYLQAEQTLLGKIGWEKFDQSQPKSYAISLNHVNNVKRIDAEHFQPKYEKLLAHIKKAGNAKQIHKFLAGPILKGVTPEYIPGEEIVVVNSQHLGRYCLNFEGTDRTSDTFWRRNKRAQIKQFDVMIYATGAYVGRTNPYLENAKALAGVDLLLVRPNEECNPLYLSVYLNSPVGIWQAEKFASGSGQRHIYPDDVKQFLVYLPSNDFQEKIADLVIKSYQARKKAKTLLEEAKRKVEELIEKKISGDR